MPADATPKTVLFLCTGNYYRSRFAELLFNHLAAQHGLAWRADSRGLDPDPYNVGPISRHTLQAVQKLGIVPPDPPRFPIRAIENDFQSCHLIVAVKEAEHRSLLEQFFPTVVDRVEFWHVHDLDCAGPDEAIPQLERLVAGLVDRLTARRSPNQ
jgi:protein-tyrosine phosphatase